MVVGPKTERIPVPQTTGDLPGDSWLLDAGVPGVRVVEQPLSSNLDSNRQGVVTIAVDPGARLVVTSSRNPWRIGPPTNEHEKLAATSKTEGAKAARAMARGSLDTAGG